ncbi:carboxypeptidase regulatory-like domain-containing protein [Sessilibacter corallicola]|uniref:TonB-dependent receptor n=1 Tax=Sessilibacter corallicola TaxID=2904075 RepID=A0ABQ0A8Y0_9GAMM
MKPFTKQRLAAAVLLAAGATGAIAQETTSAITGQITGPNGNPTSAVVRIVHVPSNTASEVSTNANGRFSARGLRVGGPYRIVVDSSTFQDETQEGIFLQLGETFNFNAVLGDGNIEEVTVIADASALNNTATGPSSTFNLDDIKSIPAINRDIKDIIRADPRIHLDPANGNAIQCGGANPRFNSLTVDGVRLNDEFGLRQGGFPTNRVPFSLDSIDQVAVELAPFDVQYSGFTACNINAVTKSGTNEWHGGVFYDYTDDSLTGDELEGDELNVADFDETRFGFHIGGPIIKDKLFFFASYEKLEGADTFDRGPSDSNTAEPVPDFTQADFDRIRQISQDVYGYDPGGIPTSFDNEDEKILAKIDWNISDSQRLALTYNYIDGFETRESDGDFDEFEFANHLYEDGAELTSYSAQLFSTWTENFTTEIKIGFTDLDNRQDSLDGGEFGEVQIDVGDSTIYLGSDDSRQANDLNYENLNFKIAGTYYAGNHTFSGGFEYQDLEVFNLFVQEAIGEYRFSSIDDFEAGLANRVTYESAVGTNDPNDAAAEFSYQIGSVYGQYEYTFNNVDLTLLFGLRYDFYESDDTPTFNPNLSDAIGFSNADNLDGADLLQPRFGFQYNVDGNLELHGGIGLYSGGNPNVWISNNYSNTGITQVEFQERQDFRNDGPPIDLFNDLTFTGDGTPIANLPQEGIDFVANAPADGVVGRTNVLDPDFDIPSEWKFNIGASLDVGNGYILQTDFIHTEKQDSAIVVDNALEQVGTTFDGRPIYESRFTDPNEPSFGATQVFELTNVDGDSGSSSIISLNLSKEYNNGLSFSVGYAGTRSEEVTAMASSVAFSNFTNTAITDLNDPGVATSNFETQHRFTFRLAYETEFFADYRTKFSLFGVSSQNRSYSYTFGSRGFLNDPSGSGARNLLYVPTGVDDANVNFADGFDTEGFFNFVDRVGLDRGEVAGRNSIEGSWWTRFDFRIDQELPGFTPDTRSNVFLIVENIGNLIDDDYGVLYQAPFPQFQQVVDASYDDTTDTYTFNRFINAPGEVRERQGSVWEVRIGFDYSF